MKKVILNAIAVAVVLGGVAYSQNESDQAYIKAMTANSPAERVTLLKDFLAKFGGKGVQYENFANANLCIIPWQGKTEQETVTYGDKALALGGLDNVMKRPRPTRSKSRWTRPRPLPPSLSRRPPRARRKSPRRPNGTA